MADGKYYVYELIDPRCGSVFYIGKGQRDRVQAHEREAKAGKPGEKCDLIREIWAEGLRVERKIVKRFSNELEAYAFEAMSIARIGISNLTNQTGGGYGGRIKIGPDDPLDEAKRLLSYIRIWSDSGRPSVVTIGGSGKIDLAAVIRGYAQRISGIAQKIGADRVAEAARQMNIDLVVQP